MSFDCKSAFSSSDFSIPKSSAHVILFNIETDAVKLREAKSFGRKVEFEKFMRNQTTLADPKRENKQEIFKIVFYGAKDIGKSLINSLKDVETSHMDDEQPVHSKNTTRSSRVWQDQQSSSNDIYKLLAAIRDDQRDLKHQLNKFEHENRDMKQKLDEIIEKSGKERKQNRISCSEFAEVVQHCTVEVAKKRLDTNFEEKLAKIPWDSIKVSKEDRQNITDELRFERRVSKMISKIGAILFGSELVTHLLGRHGKRERTRRETERPHVFSIHQESRLRKVLSVFDDVFLSDKAWKAIVQYHINQKGRDCKKARKRVIEDSENESSSDSDSGKSKSKKKRDSDEPSSDSSEASSVVQENIGKKRAKNQQKDMRKKTKSISVSADEDETEKEETMKDNVDKENDDSTHSNSVQVLEESSSVNKFQPLLSQKVPLTQI